MLIALHLLSTMKVSSKLATSSSSNPAVGETVACHAIEPRSPLGRHGGRERRGLPAAHRLRAVLAKFFSYTAELHCNYYPAGARRCNYYPSHGCSSFSVAGTNQPTSAVGQTHVPLLEFR